MSIVSSILAVLLASTTVDSIRVATFDTSLYRDSAGDYPFPASDRRLVYVDLDWTGDRVDRRADPIR